MEKVTAKIKSLEYRLEKHYKALDALLDLEKYRTVSITAPINEIRSAITDLNNQLEKQWVFKEILSDENSNTNKTYN